MAKQRVVVVGAGFGGLTCARALAGCTDFEVTVVDRTNHHLFQPLLYQVATAGLAAPDIAAPVRSLLADQANAQVLLAEVLAVDLEARAVRLRGQRELRYDWLVLALGAKTSYFGHDEWEAHAPGLKTLDDALEIRNRVLLAFERAEIEEDERRRERLLTFVIIGGGATGVELAGSIAELAQRVLSRDFRRIRPQQARVLLIEGGDAVLGNFGAALSASAREQLEELGVSVHLGAPVKSIEEGQVVLTDGTRIDAATTIWAAGVRATRLAASIGTRHDRSGRVIVERDCSVPGYPEVFAIGDMAHHAVPGPDGTPQPLPGVSPVAMQQARYVATIIRDEQTVRERARAPFEYFDKGHMATIGRSRAIAKTGRLELTGLLAWLAWLFVHLVFLVSFRNRFVVLFNWIWQYFSFKRGARVVLGRYLQPSEVAQHAAREAWLPSESPRSQRTPLRSEPSDA